MDTAAALKALREAISEIKDSEKVLAALSAVEDCVRADASYADYVESLIPDSIKKVGMEPSELRMAWEKDQKQSSPAQAGSQSGRSRLEPPREKILEFLWDKGEADLDHISRGVSLSRQAARFHLEELRLVDMISAYTDIDSTVWYLDQKGRGYLLGHGLRS